MHRTCLALQVRFAVMAWKVQKKVGSCSAVDSFYRHLLGIDRLWNKCKFFFFWEVLHHFPMPSKYYTGGVLQIPSDGDDPWKLKSTPKKNEYFEYFNKFTAKKSLSQKILERKISNQEKNILRSSPWLGKTGQSTTPSPIPGENGKFP